MFPILKGCVQFLVDFLIEDSTEQYLVTNPSLSPENTFLDHSKAKGVLCEGSTIDIQIISAVFSAFMESSFELKMDDELLPIVLKARERLPPMSVGSFDQLQEWR